MKAYFEHRSYSSKTQIFASLIDNLDFAAHWHSDIELVYVLEGSLGVGNNMQYRVITSGDLFVCGSNDIHYYKSEGMKSKVLLLIFKPELLDSLCTGGKKINPHSAIFDESSEEFIKDQRKIAMDILVNESSNNEYSLQILKLRVLELFLIIFRNSSSYYLESTANRKLLYSSVQPIQIALKYIEDNYNQDISLETISNKANLSPYYFSRLFKKTTGTNFKTYLNHIRINKAAEIISSTQKRIIDIAYETGFGSIRTFNRTFLTITGSIPSALRK